MSIGRNAVRLRDPMREPRVSDYVMAAVAMIVIGIGFSWIVGLPVSIACGDTPAPVLEELCFLPAFVGLAAVFGLPALPVGILIMWALREAGFGGWMVAMGLGGAIGAAAALLMAGGIPAETSDAAVTGVMAASGAFLATVYWIAIRFRCRLPDPPQK